MTQADIIISKFGGLSALASALGHRHPTTVQGWRDRGVIPTRQQSKVLAAASASGIPLTPADFFPEATPEPAQ